MSGHTADSVLPLSQGNPCARFFGWTCLFALIALCSGLVDPSLLDPAHKHFILLIGGIGLWRYGNAAMHYLGLASQQHILDGDLLPVQSLLLETTLKHGCVAQLDLLAEQQPSAPLQRAPRCGQSI